MKVPAVFFAICVSIWWARVSAASKELTKSWTLYHSNPPTTDTFQKRGQILLKVEGTEIKLSIQNEPDIMKDFSTSGWYQLKLIPNVGSVPDNASSTDIVTTVPACHLRRANFRDELILMLSESGHALSLSYVPLVSPLAVKSCESLEPLSSLELQSKISYETPTAGMNLRVVLNNEKPPPGLLFLPFKKQVNSPGESPNNAHNPLLNTGSLNGETPSPSGPFQFISRYWYLFIPLLILNLFLAPSEQTQPQPQQQQQQLPQQEQPSGKNKSDTTGHFTAATAVELSSSSGGGNNVARQRRGKRAQR